MGKTYFKYLDHGWLEYWGGQGGLKSIIGLSSVVDK